MSLIVTKAALALNNAEANFQKVKFESHKPKVKTISRQNNVDHLEKIGKESGGKDLNLKKIRHEIVKFGMSGFDALKKEEAKIALAVSLGAKPPKRQYMNYKELMQKRKEEKSKLIQEKQLMMSKSVMQSVGKPKRNKKPNVGNDVGHFLSSYGKVQKKDLEKKDKGSKKKRK